VFGAANTDAGWEGMIVDVLAEDRHALRALLLEAVATLRAHGCDRVSLSYLDPRPWSGHAVLRSGFRPVEPLVNVVARSFTGPSVSEDLAAWYLTLGDTERV
jgi:hypothetical protein